jgi:hypothetical protein
MKIVSATTETPGMTKEQVDMFLEGKFMLQMSTLDEKGEPNIQPVWFYHDKDSAFFDNFKVRRIEPHRSNKE